MIPHEQRDDFDDDFEANERDDFGTVKSLGLTGVQVNTQFAQPWNKQKADSMDKFQSPARGQKQSYQTAPETGFFDATVQPVMQQNLVYADERPIKAKGAYDYEAFLCEDDFDQYSDFEIEDNFAEKETAASDQSSLYRIVEQYSQLLDQTEKVIVDK